MKKIISIFIVFIILISTVLTAPAHALAVEIIGGSYVAYAILAAALAAAGYTIATSQIDSETFQAILDSSGAEDIKALITATQVYTTVNGRVFFNWSTQQWFTFINWVNSYISSGSLVIPSAPSGDIISTSFVVSQISSYYETFIPTSTGVIGANIGNNNIVTLVYSGQTLGMEWHLSNATFVGANSVNTTNSAIHNGSYLFVSPFYVSNGSIKTTIGIGVNSRNTIVSNRNDVTKCYEWLSNTWNQVIYNDLTYTVKFSNGNIYLRRNNIDTQITGTINFTQTYTSLLEYMTDVINTGALVGDFTGIGEDVINPGRDIEVGIDSYPQWRVGTGVDALPDSLEDGASIDIPLNPYIETDLGPDVVDPYVDFTPWDTTTVPPDDVIPDTRLNPPADVTANPDTPWADDQTYPLDYPTDTVTDDLPPGNNPNPDPSSDDKTNRLKLGPLLLSKFPFCLPWDLQHALKVLIAPAEAPVFTIPFVNERLGINESLTIDLSFADRLAQVTRWFLSALWVVILILITSKIIWK